jgi:hypothetical protein
LCNLVSQDEWSGSLFYTTEGVFGQEGFTCTAQYIFLQDIGTGTYTEYDYDSKFTTFLMKNPQFMDMKVGHIHSHNNMSVFFSGTDQSEIEDNSACHNIYLSLIVNNRNDMEAKIAVRADRKSQIKDEYKFPNEKGEIITMYDEVATEDSLVMIYNCEIEKPSFPGMDPEFRKQFEEVQKKKEEKKPTWSYSGGNGAYSGFHGGQRYDGLKQHSHTPDYDAPVAQGTLYPDDSTEQAFDWGDVEDPKEEFSTLTEFKRIYDHAFEKTILGKKKQFYFDNDTLRNFIKAVISDNFNFNKDIGWTMHSVLHTAEKTKRAMLSERKQWDVELGKRLYKYYIYYFAEDNGYDFMQEVLNIAVDEVKEHSVAFKTITDEIAQVFRRAEVV